MLVMTAASIKTTTSKTVNDRFTAFVDKALNFSIFEPKIE